MATEWLDISDETIEAYKPPLSDIGLALVHRDRCNASKPIPVTDAYGQHGSTQAYILSGGLLWTFRVFIPHDVPSGWKLYLPVYVNIVDSGTGTPSESRVWLRIGTLPDNVDGSIFQVPAGSSGEYEPTLTIPVSTFRGTEVACELRGKLDKFRADNTTTIQGGPPCDAMVGLASIRRPA